jgi:hypothetical protein
MLAVFEKVLKLANVKVLNLSMDSKFGHQLLFRSDSRKTCFKDDLASVNLLSFSVGNLVASCKSALTKQLPLGVNASVIFSCREFYGFDDFLLVF